MMRHHGWKACLLQRAGLACSVFVLGACAGVPYAAAQGVTLSTHADDSKLSNDAISISWRISQNTLSHVVIVDHVRSNQVKLASPFSLRLQDGTVYDADHLTVTGKHTEKDLEPDSQAARLVEHFPGKEVSIPLKTADGTLSFIWKVILRDGSKYVREELTSTAAEKDIPIEQIRFIDAVLPSAHVSGTVAGSPVVAGNVYLGVENPLSFSSVTNDRAAAGMKRTLPLRAGQSVTYSAVIGIATRGQMRRDFLAYLERERAHPYRTFLHYNSWYDIGYFNPYDEAGAVDRIHAYGTELTEKRGVKLSSFLFDDGWDNHESLWQFNNGFPQGFTPVRKAAEQYGADPGIWLSPWGGYDKPKEERIAFGRKNGYEIVDDGYALSGPKYYEHFRDVCVDLIKKYGVNQFKLDGTGNANTVFPGSAFDSDFAAAIHLIGELRAVKPDLFINLTTGTYPSPFWLLYADSIWRGGEDDDFTGVGSDRERWLTYRDAETYRGVVQAGPLFPLNSLMLHGIIYAKLRKKLNNDSGNDFRNEVRSYFGTGTQLQELYMSPSLLTKQNWDDVAEAANWSRANADVLRDTHWVGGNPAWLEVYGWASWSAHKSILTLRNPSDHVQRITVDPGKVLELPASASRHFNAKSPWASDTGHAVLKLDAGVPHTFELAPFEVKTLDLTSQ
jgi:hypothetical protein